MSLLLKNSKYLKKIIKYDKILCKIYKEGLCNMISMEVYNKCLEFKERTGRWPRFEIKVDGKIISRKDITGKKKYRYLLEEFDLAHEWKRSPERELLMKYKGLKIEDVPEEYQDMIRTLRSFGVGVGGKTVDIVEEFAKFYKTYGRVPQRGKDGKAKTKEEQIEKRLYHYWCTCKENKLLEEYVSVELKDIPEEHRAMIEKLRSMGLGLKSKKTTNLADYISFVRDKRREPVYMLHPKSNEDIYERDLKQRWRMCKEYSTYKKYKGILLEEIPEEDRNLVEKIRNLWQEVDGTNITEDMINFIEKYKREPREIKEEFKNFDRELTEEEQNERLLNARWNRSFEKQVLDRFVGIQIDEIPKGYKKIVEEFRKIGLGFPESINTRRYIDFILEHKRIPRQVICRNGKNVDAKNCTEEELEERTIRHRWDRSYERQIFDRYRSSSLDDKTAALYSGMIKSLEDAYKLVEAEEVRISEEKRKQVYENKNAEKKSKQKKRSMEDVKREESTGRDEKNEEEKKRITEEQRRAKEERKRIAEERRRAKEQKRKIAEEKERIRAEKRRRAEEEDRVKAEEKRIMEETKRAEQQAEEDRKKKITEENKGREEELKKKAIEQKILNSLEIARSYLTFIRTYNRIPRIGIRVGNKTIELDKLPQDEREEVELARNWRSCRFMETIESYVGVPIEKLPKIYRDIITDYRALGFGLTLEEYIKYRDLDVSGSLLKRMKKARKEALRKKDKAFELEQEVIERLGLNWKEQNDE